MDETQRASALARIENDLGYALIDMIYNRITMANTYRSLYNMYLAREEQKEEEEDADSQRTEDDDATTLGDEAPVLPAGVRAGEAWSLDSLGAELNFNRCVVQLNGRSAPATYEQFVTLCLFMDQSLCQAHSSEYFCGMSDTVCRRPKLHTAASMFGHMMLELIQLSGTVKLKPEQIDEMMKEDQGRFQRLFSGAFLSVKQDAGVYERVAAEPPQWVFEPEYTTADDILPTDPMRQGRPLYHGIIKCNLCEGGGFANQMQAFEHAEVCPIIVSKYDKRLDGQAMDPESRPKPNVYPFHWFEQQSLFTLEYDTILSMANEARRLEIEDADTDMEEQ